MIMQGVPHLGTLAFPHGLSLRSPIRGGRDAAAPARKRSAAGGGGSEVNGGIGPG